jgi:hypothetical protein
MKHGKGKILGVTDHVLPKCLGLRRALENNDDAGKYVARGEKHHSDCSV